MSVGTGSTGAGGAIALNAGSSSGAGHVGGGLVLSAGDGDAVGGDISLSAGLSASSTGGAMQLQSGASASGASGSVDIKSADGSATGAVVLSHLHQAQAPRHRVT